MWPLKKPNFIRRIGAFVTRFNGPMATGNQFLVLDDNYLSRFDDIVVVGDIHGCYKEFKELLDKVHAETPTRNPDRCLKILVGDLVNKGPENKKVLKLCRDLYPNSILAVRGNHDEIVLHQFEQFKSTGKSLESRNQWIETLPTRYIQYLQCLPYTISIPPLNCVIVHAGLDPSLDDPIRETPTNLMTTMRNIVVEKVIETGGTRYKCTKSNKEGAVWATFWPGPQRVYFGHDARRRLQDQHEFAVGLDTGCVYGDRLSYTYIKGPRKDEIFFIEAKEVYEATSDTETVDGKRKDAD